MLALARTLVPLRNLHRRRIGGARTVLAADEPLVEPVLQAFRRPRVLRQNSPLIGKDRFRGASEYVPHRVHGHRLDPVLAELPHDRARLGNGALDSPRTDAVDPALHAHFYLLQLPPGTGALDGLADLLQNVSTRYVDSGVLRIDGEARFAGVRLLEEDIRPLVDEHPSDLREARVGQPRAGGRVEGRHHGVARPQVLQPPLAVVRFQRRNDVLVRHRVEPQGVAEADRVPRGVVVGIGLPHGSRWGVERVGGGEHLRGGVVEALPHPYEPAHHQFSARGEAHAPGQESVEGGRPSDHRNRERIGGIGRRGGPPPDVIAAAQDSARAPPDRARRPVGHRLPVRQPDDVDAADTEEFGQRSGDIPVDRRPAYDCRVSERVDVDVDHLGRAVGGAVEDPAQRSGLIPRVLPAPAVTRLLEHPAPAGVVGVVDGELCGPVRLPRESALQAPRGVVGVLGGRLGRPLVRCTGAPALQARHAPGRVVDPLAPAPRGGLERGELAPRVVGVLDSRA